MRTKLKYGSSSQSELQEIIFLNTVVISGIPSNIRLEEKEANEGILDKIINAVLEPDRGGLREKADRLSEVIKAYKM